MTRKDITRTQWTCDWNCNSQRRLKYTAGSMTERAQLPNGWLQIWGGGDPGAGDLYPIHLCPDCAELYNYCKSGSSERGKRFREFYKAFRDSEKAFIETVDPEAGPFEAEYCAMPKTPVSA